MKLTATNVKTLPAPRGRSEAVFFDDDVKGFGVRVKPSGARSYVMCWKVAGRHRRITIGAVSEIDFGKAKKKAGDYKAAVRLGADPTVEIKTAKLSAAQTFEPTAEQFITSLERKAPADRLSSDWLVEIRRHLIGNRSEDGRPLTCHAKPLHNKAVAQITRQDIVTVVGAVTAKSGSRTGNLVCGSLSRFFAWAMEQGHVQANPAIGIKRSKLKSRSRVLTPAELRLIWHAAGDDDYGSIVKLLALTGQRAGEIGDLRRSEVYDSEIIFPGERTKNGEPHVVPLAPQALQIIDSRLKYGMRDLLFGRGDGGFSGWSKSKERLDERIAKANGGSAIPDWRIHDLRRTFVTLLGGGLPEHELKKLPPRDRKLAEGLGELPHVVEAAVNHISGHKAGVAGVYNRSTYAKEKRIALDRWATHLALIVSGGADNVTPMRRKG
jgi:integrase